MSEDAAQSEIDELQKRFGGVLLERYMRALTTSDDPFKMMDTCVKCGGEGKSRDKKDC